MPLELRYSWKTDTASGEDRCQIAADLPKNEADLRAIEVEVIGIAARRLNVDDIEVLIFDWKDTSDPHTLKGVFSPRHPWRR
jgi:hypothetical protein